MNINHQWCFKNAYRKAIQKVHCLPENACVMKDFELTRASIPPTAMMQPLLPSSLPTSPLYPFLLTGFRGYHPLENFGIKDSCRCVLEHFPQRPYFCPRGFPWRILRRRVFLRMSLELTVENSCAVVWLTTTRREQTSASDRQWDQVTLTRLLVAEWYIVCMYSRVHGRVVFCLLINR